ncbi:MAG: response regulator transcription factor [Armatimonadota bacterium]
MGNNRIALLIVDQLAVVRRGLREILRSEPGITIVGEAAGIPEALSLAERLHPDVVMMDMVAPYDTMYQAVRTLRTRTKARSLAFAGSDDWVAVKPFMESGGMGYLSKRSSEAEIIKAIKSVQAGATYISPLLRQLSETPRYATALSKRECEIMSLIALGYTGLQIADRLCISPKTVETHRARISSKLGLQSRAQLVQYALNNGLIHAGH